MTGLLFRLANLIPPTSAVAAEEFSGTGTIGFVVLAIIVGPVLILTIAAMFDAPRTFRLPGLFVGSLILLIGAIVISFAISGLLLGFLVPR